MTEPTLPKEIKFKPLSEGLGFHPFSDGLPYAPISKTQQQPLEERKFQPLAEPMGTGAVAAGKPKYAIPSRPHMVAPHSLESRARIAPSATQAKPSLSVNTQAIKTPPLAPVFGWKYSLSRFVAFFLDLALNLSICAAIIGSALWNQTGDLTLLLVPNIAPLSVLFGFFFSWALTTAQEILFGTSLGKRVFGLTLNGSLSAVFLRAFFFLPSLLFGGLGILWVLFDRRKRCWHDVASELQPTQVTRL